jgi:hypothetical protein
LQGFLVIVIVRAAGRANIARTPRLDLEPLYSWLRSQMV